MIAFIYSFAFFTIYGYITNSQSDQVPDGLIAQLVEHCTGMADVMGSSCFRVVYATAMINYAFI